jgi:hypothetical protein
MILTFDEQEGAAPHLENSEYDIENSSSSSLQDGFEHQSACNHCTCTAAFPVGDIGFFYWMGLRSLRV